MEKDTIKEMKVAEFKRLLIWHFDFEIKIKLHFSQSKNNDYVYGIYQADKKFWFWKTADVFLGEISAVDLSLPFDGDEWEDLNVVIVDRSVAYSFMNFAKDYEEKTGKKVNIEKLY